MFGASPEVSSVASSVAPVLVSDDAVPSLVSLPEELDWVGAAVGEPEGNGFGFTVLALGPAVPPDGKGAGLDATGLLDEPAVWEGATSGATPEPLLPAVSGVPVGVIG